MTLPCGHTDDEHRAALCDTLDGARAHILSQLRRAVVKDPFGWPRVLTDLADLQRECDTQDLDPMPWHDRLYDWSDENMACAMALATWTAQAGRMRLATVVRAFAAADAPRAALAILAFQEAEEGDKVGSEAVSLCLEAFDTHETLSMAVYCVGGLTYHGIGRAALVALADQAAAGVKNV